LTMVRAWIAAGKPAGDQTLGSYESFTEVVGGILSIAEVPGFLANRDRVYAEADQEVIAWAEFCHIWWQEFGERAMKTELIFGIARRHKLLIDIWSGRDEHAAHTAFGKALARMRDRVIGGLRIRRVGEDSNSKVMTYRLEPISASGEGRYAGDAGVGGGFSVPKNDYESDIQKRPKESPPATTPDTSPEEFPKPQTPAFSRNPRDDPWDHFLDEVEDGTGRANSKG
jgi:putative DNA primase/helicase